MKVLMANKFFFLNGGSERVFFQEREFLKSKNIPVVDFSMEDERNYPSDYATFFIPKVDFTKWPKTTASLKKAVLFVHSAEAVRRLSRLVDKERPDIAHLHNIYHQITPSVIPMLKSKGVKVVLTLHDVKLACPSYLMLNNGVICERCEGRHFYKAVTTGCQDSIVKSLLLMAEAYWHASLQSYERVDAFITPSRFLADLVSRYRVSEWKVAVLRNGIETERYVPRYDDQGYALYFGRLSREKGITTLLTAHARLWGGLPLKVAGTGPLERDLKSRYPDVEFLGYQTGGELMDIIRGAAFVVVPSEWYENCSMAVLEAMALGKPVIGAKVGGIPEQVEEGCTGLLFPMGDAGALAKSMDHLWRNKPLREQMGKAARRKVEEEFSLDGHCRKLLSLYRKLIGA